MSPKISIIGLDGIPIIKANDDLANIICEAANNQKTPILDGDILVITQKIVSKAECRVIKLDDITPSLFAKKVSKELGKDPRMVELILHESKSIVRMVGHHLITETRHGWICANSGVDRSNVSGGDSIALLPIDPDTSAKKIRKRIQQISGAKVAVIISDTFGRPFRLGHVDVCIGISGLSPLLDLRGKKDIYNYELRVKRAAIGDELASAAELVIGNCNEQIPVAIIRGYEFIGDESAKAIDAIMPREKNLFM